MRYLDVSTTPQTRRYPTVVCRETPSLASLVLSPCPKSEMDLIGWRVDMTMIELRGTNKYAMDHCLSGGTYVDVWYLNDTWCKDLKPDNLLIGNDGTLQIVDLLTIC